MARLSFCRESVKKAAFFSTFLDLYQEIKRNRKKVGEKFVCVHKRYYLCSRKEERKDKEIDKKDNLKGKERKKIMMTFGIMTVAVVVFAVIAGAGMNFGINACK